MKKLTTISLILLFSCSSNDSSENSIEGKWNFTGLKTNGADYNLDSCSLQSYMLLSENGSGLYYIFYTDYPDNPEIEPCGLDDTYNVSSTYITGNSFSMTWDYGGGDVENGTAELNNNTLIFKSIYDGVNYENSFTKD